MYMDGPKIIAGDLDTSQESGYEQKRGISNILIHPDWLGADISFKNDVCLLTLDSPLELNDQVKSIALDDTTQIPGQAMCKVSGWGTLSVRILSFLNFIVICIMHISGWWVSTRHLTMGMVRNLS